MSMCSCWVDYPNVSHKKKNGKWKCVDYYSCIYTGLKSNYRCRTKCEMKDGYTKNGKVKECYDT